MTDRPDVPATPDIEPARGRRRLGISAVWLVPLAAVLIALAIIWQSFQDRGSLISITFPDASGLTIGETTLRFREVIVGVVEDVGFSDDLNFVNAFVRVESEIAPYLDEDAAFWIVQPTVTTRGVEGLGTILSGTYIQGTWDSEIGETKDAFVGDERAPIVPPGVDGTAIVLRAGDSARLGAGAPILFRGIQVGEVAAPRLSPDGTEVRLDAFILAPYDRQLTTATRFWDASGVSVSFGGSGVELSVGSIAAILEGGINFDTLISGGEPITSGDVFDIFEDRGDALASTFEAPTSRSVRFGALFPSAASGLSEGSAVRFQGVRVGVVTAITGFIRPDDPTGEVQLLAVMAIQPTKMGLAEMRTDLDGIDFVSDLVDAGLRAQLVSTSLLGGDLAVDLVDVVAPAQASLEIGIADNPLIPSIEGDTSSISDTAEGVLARINDLPVEALLAAATDLLNNVNRIAADPDTRAIPAATRAAIEQGGGLVRDARAIVSSPGTAGALADVQAIVSDLRAVSARIAAREVADTLADTLDAAFGAAANIRAGTADLEALSQQAFVLFDDAGRLVSSADVQAIPALAREAIEGGRAVLTSPAIAAILEDTAAVTGDIRSLAARLATDALAERVESVLASIDAAARDVALGTADLGDLRASLDASVAGAQALLTSADVQAIPALAREATQGARDVLASPELPTILADIAASTGDIRALTAALGTAEAAARVTTLLRNVDRAARNVAAGTADLDALRASIDAAASGAATLLASEDVAAIPALAREATQGARDILTAPEIDAVLSDLAVAVSDIRSATAELGTPEAAARIETLLANVDDAARNVAEGTQDLATLRTTLDSAVAGAESILVSPDVQAIPALLREAVTETRDAVAAPEIDTALSNLSGITQDVRALTARLGTDAIAARIESVLQNVDAASRDVAAGTSDLSALRASLDATIGGAEAILTAPEARAIPGTANDAIGEILGLAGDARAIVGSAEIQALLTDLPRISADIRAITDQLAQQQAATALTAALQAAERAAASVADGAEALPAISASTERVLAEAEILAGNLNALTQKANALDLASLVDATTDVMRTADVFLSSDEAGDVPVVLSATLEEVRQTIETIRTGGTLDNVNATLGSTAAAADSIRTSVADLPALVARLQTLTGTATDVLSAYDGDSRVAQELAAALRAATRAAEDVSSLSRTIERNPNSLLLGR